MNANVPLPHLPDLGAIKPPGLHPKPPKTAVRSIFVSDVHLGTKDAKAQQLTAFLKAHSCENLFLVGDIIDGWKMRKGVAWNKDATQLLRRILKMAKNGVNVYYITGNHDEFLRPYASMQLDAIKLVNQWVHQGADNKRYWVIHGDQFEGVTHCQAWLQWVGDYGYDFLMWLNRIFNRVRQKYAVGYWSFAGFLKQRIKTAQRYVQRFEIAVAQGAHQAGYDGVICGHIHQCAHKHLLGVEYFNTGDWVESCSAVIEELDGSWRTLQLQPQAPVREPVATQARVGAA
jgi:UDP-2,3-diacylglucosamine pyrophosphatase LpxH